MTGTRLRLLFEAAGAHRWILLKRYPVNTLSQMVMVYAFFAVIFFGGRAVARTAITNSLEGIVVGYFLWTMAVGAYTTLASGTTREAQWGTLEQLYMSPFGFGTVNAVKILVYQVESFAWGALILVLMLLTTGVTLHIDVLTVGVLTLLTLGSAVGLGFVMGGLAIVYKRVENLFNVMQFLFIGFIAAPAVDLHPALEALPLSLGSGLLFRAMSDGLRLWELPTADVALLVVKSVLYVGIGYLVFTRFVASARRRGVLGHY